MAEVGVETSEGSEETAFEDEEGQQPYTDALDLDRGVITTPYDAPVRTLTEEVREKVLIVNPDFQRQGVWKIDRKSKLIESLLLNIPIPVLYFAEDEDGTRVVVDGQQRLRAITEFHSGTYRLSGLQVLSALNGKSWTDLTPKQARTISSRTLRCVVISANSPATLRFEMFERLNTGGVPLNDQELRNCVFRGSLNRLLNDIVSSKGWLRAVGRAAPDPRLKHHELALRFLALDGSVSEYRPPLKSYLNAFMKRQREPSPDSLAEMKQRVLTSVDAVLLCFGSDAFRKPKSSVQYQGVLNRAVFDCQMLGLAGKTAEQVAPVAEKIRKAFTDLVLKEPGFDTTLSLATADRAVLLRRLRIWGRALAEMGLQPEYLATLPSD